MKKDNPYGDDGGARVGEPDTPQRNNKGKGPLGAGMEVTGGLPKAGKPQTQQDGAASHGKQSYPKTDSGKH